MILLDNQVYITQACNLLQKAPAYRIIPLGVSCLTGSDFFITSIINLISIFLTLYLLFGIFGLNKKQKIWATLIFGFNSYIAFPYFYAAAHSYVYTILFSVLTLLSIHIFNKKNIYSIAFLILCGFSLKLVRSEGPLYFAISFIAYLIHRYLSTDNLADFWRINKSRFIAIGYLFMTIILANYLLKYIFSGGELITKNISDGKYTYQFPRQSFYAVSIWATFDYLRAFITPHYMNFFGNYNDWYMIHKNESLRVILYSLFGGISLFSSYFIIKRKKTTLTYLIIGLSIFIIPGFLISSFLRNQWFYPSRSLLGCFLALPFFVSALLSLKNAKTIKLITGFTFTLFLSTFIFHNLFHFKNEKTMYEYETQFLGKNHPTLNKSYAQYLFKEKKFLKSTKILREANKILPEEAVFLSANMFFLWAENLYWSAASSFFYKSPLTEEMVLKKLYKHPNFFSALACLQDTRIPIEVCSKEKNLRYLCHPSYKKKFGYTYYKNPRIKAQKLCADFLNHRI